MTALPGRACRVHLLPPGPVSPAGRKTCRCNSIAYPNFHSDPNRGVLFSAFLPCLVVIPLTATLWLFIRVYCYIFAIVLEKKGIVQSLKRSWYLTSGNFWYVLKPTLIIAVPILLVSVILTFIFGAIFGVDFWMDWSLFG
jgi:membrane-anchored glycerophosphoryl diester phosphodiesterase (GDPDase)